jgi:peptide deformylase
MGSGKILGMSVVPIVIEPNKVLHEKCDKIKEFGPETKELVRNLLDTLNNAKNPEGAGLAAPQIGVLKRACIVRRFTIDPKNPDTEQIEHYVLINPKITSASKEKDVDWEGCLSIPNTYGRVKRPSKIKVRAYDVNGEELKITASGFFARVIQHEIDHLDGVLFTTKYVGKLVTENELDEIFSKTHVG